MNTRERTLMFALIAVLGCGGGLYAGIRWWWEPLQEYNKTIDKLTRDNEEEEYKWDTFLRNKKRLNAARLRSLPNKPDQAAAVCMSYLEPLLSGAGLELEDISKTSVAKVKLVNQIQGVKEVGHQIVTFTVRARGDLAQIVKALEKIQAAPFEHRIRNLTVDRTDSSTKKDASSKLTVQIILETLLIARTENTGLPSSDAKSDVPQHAANRYYGDIAKKNIFIGMVPLPPVTTKPPPVPVDEGPEAPDEYTPRYIYLTQTLVDQQTAYLRNRIYAFPRGEKKLTVGLKGYEEFQVTDETGDYLFFRAKLLKVEQRKIYFQIGMSHDAGFPSKSVFTVQIGQPLSDAKDYSANRTRIDLIDDDLFDEAFEAAEDARNPKTKGKDNKGNATKTKGGTKGGNTKKGKMGG